MSPNTRLHALTVAPLRLRFSTLREGSNWMLNDMECNQPPNNTTHCPLDSNNKWNIERPIQHTVSLTGNTTATTNHKEGGHKHTTELRALRLPIIDVAALRRTDRHIANYKIFQPINAFRASTPISHCIRIPRDIEYSQVPIQHRIIDRRCHCDQSESNSANTTADVQEHRIQTRCLIE